MAKDEELRERDPLELASLHATREVLEAHGLAPKKRLGQNFLVSRWVLERILERAELSPGEGVLEIGPGIGTLTRALLGQGAVVVAVEADDGLLPVLKDTCAFGWDRVALIHGDALRVTPEDLIQTFERKRQKLGESAGYPGLVKFVANLPYTIAATALLNEFSQLASLKRAVVMVQREVADRMVAKPGTKVYGAYSVKLALRARVINRFEVGRQEFWPQPHVDSTVLTLDRRATWDERWARAVSAVVDGAFAQRRKTLANSLATMGYERATTEAALVSLGLDPKLRAERLSPEEFCDLAQKLGISPCDARGAPLDGMESDRSKTRVKDTVAQGDRKSHRRQSQ